MIVPTAHPSVDAVVAGQPGSAVFYDFPARPYLRKYYDAVGPENSALLHAIGDFVRAFPGPTESIIEVAGGPSLFSLIAVAAERGRPFERITFTDIAPQNLDEVRWWLADDERQFDYDGVLRWLAGERDADRAAVVSSLRKSEWQILQRDWLLTDDRALHGAYDVVSSHFFAESATSDEDEFLTMLRTVRRLGRPNALMLLSFMTRSAGYRIDGLDFPAFAVDGSNIEGYLERAGIGLDGFAMRSVATEVSSSESGYDGLIFIGGRLRAA
jgi:hypothetical protein